MKHAISVVAITFSTLTATAQLPTALAKLDTAAAGFRNATANVRYDTYTRVVRDHAIQTGTIYIERSGKANTMGAVFFDEGSKSPAKILNYDGGTLHMFTPGTNQDDIFAAGANQAKYESFLTLGFGGSGKDLAANWSITDLGTETINGVKSEKLDLVAKDPGVRNLFRHVTIWVDLSRGVSVRQTFFQPGSKPDTDGDYRTADYTDIKTNTKIDTKPYAIKKGAQVVRH
jgi:outer membrane lipoprotein-sorting protein